MKDLVDASLRRGPTRHSEKSSRREQVVRYPKGEAQVSFHMGCRRYLVVRFLSWFFRWCARTFRGYLSNVHSGRTSRRCVHSCSESQARLVPEGWFSTADSSELEHGSVNVLDHLCHLDLLDQELDRRGYVLRRLDLPALVWDSHACNVLSRRSGSMLPLICLRILSRS